MFLLLRKPYNNAVPSYIPDIYKKNVSKVIVAYVNRINIDSIVEHGKIAKQSWKKSTLHLVLYLNNSDD